MGSGLPPSAVTTAVRKAAPVSKIAVQSANRTFTERIGSSSQISEGRGDGPGAPLIESARRLRERERKSRAKQCCGWNTNQNWVRRRGRQLFAASGRKKNRDKSERKKAESHSKGGDTVRSEDTEFVVTGPERKARIANWPFCLGFRKSFADSDADEGAAPLCGSARFNRFSIVAETLLPNGAVPERRPR